MKEMQELACGHLETNTILGTGISLCKGPEADICLDCPITNKKFSVARIERMRRIREMLSLDRKEDQNVEEIQASVRHWAFSERDGKPFESSKQCDPTLALLGFSVLAPHICFS